MSNAVAYGSLYIDEGEGWIVAKKQLKSILKGENVVALFFDVIGHPEQEKESEAVIQQIKDYAKKIRPDLKKISVGFSRNGKGDMPRN